MAHEGAALEHECPGSPGNGTGGTAGRSSGGRPNAWQNAVLPHLLSLHTLLPSESSMVFRALQLVHERRLTLLVGDKPSESSSRASGHAEAAQRWQEQTIRAEARPQGPWIDPSTQAPAATYFSIESERKGRAPYTCVLPGLVDTGSKNPLRIRSQSTADHEPSISKLNSNARPSQGLCTCIEFQERVVAGAPAQSEGCTLYCKHLLAVRLSQLHLWDGLRVRHVTSANLGSWLASLETSAVAGTV